MMRLPRQVWNYARLKPVTWLEGGEVAACRYPRSEADWRSLAEQGVGVIVNLHEQAHSPERLERYAIREVHLPVRDFTAPTQEQLENGVAAINEALGNGTRVAVHCGAGLGRTGTLIACYLVSTGLSADAAIATIRSARPGSVETPEQEAAVRAFAARRFHPEGAGSE